MSNAEKIMNEVDIKYTILVSIEILPHQSAYLNIIFFTLKSIFMAKSSFSQNLYLQNQVYYDIFILFEQDVYGIIFLMFYALS